MTNSKGKHCEKCIDVSRETAKLVCFNLDCPCHKSKKKCKNCCYPEAREGASYCKKHGNFLSKGSDIQLSPESGVYNCGDFGCPRHLTTKMENELDRKWDEWSEDDWDYGPRNEVKQFLAEKIAKAYAIGWDDSREANTKHQ